MVVGRAETLGEDAAELAGPAGLQRKILGQDRQAEEGAGAGFLGQCLDRIGIGLDHGVELRIYRLDPGEHATAELARRRFAALDQGGEPESVMGGVFGKLHSSLRLARNAPERFGIWRKVCRLVAIPSSSSMRFSAFLPSFSATACVRSVSTALMADVESQ